MTFRWRYLNPAGSPVDGPAEEFDDQQDAEDWFASRWQELREAGVDAVTLLEDGAEVYGPMSLHES